MTTTETIRTLIDGHWIKDKGIYKCTACNSLCTVAGWADSISEKQMYKIFKFCPNCGAKMSEVEDHLIMPKADGSTIPKDYMGVR